MADPNLADPNMAGPMMTGAIAVNLLWCVPGDVGGSEEYLVRQLLGLAGLADSRFAPTLYVLDGFSQAHPDLATAFPSRVAPFSGASRLRRIAGETTWLRSQTAKAALTHHGGGTAPVRARRPYLLTVHDLQYRTYPQYFSGSKRRYLDAVLPRSVRGAAVVAVPSEYVRGTVIQAFDIPSEQVMVVPHGIEPTLLHDITPDDELRRKYGLGDGPIVVYPAVTHPHKNHRFLLQLMAEHWRDPDLRLVLIGGAGAAESDVATCRDPRVMRLGRVSGADRNGLLAMALAMVFPSRYEGFGAPLIEAMTLGAPVVCSDATCIPGVVGGAGLVLPLQVDAWADALDQVQAQHDRMVADGRVRAQCFTARISGQALAAAYATALEQR